MLIKTGMGMAQAHAAASTVYWERLQGALSTFSDKAMYLLVVARTALCAKGTCSKYLVAHDAAMMSFA